MKRLGMAIIAFGLMAGQALAATPTHKPAAKPAAQAVVKQAVMKKPAIPAAVIPATAPGLLPDMSLGNANAPVTVIEYASASCPHCADWNKENWATFEQKYLATGKVRYIFREVLTEPQQYALSAFLVGRCAVAQSKTPADATPYFTVVHAFFNGQDTYYSSHQIGTVFADVTAKTGMSKAAIDACIMDGPGFSGFMNNMRAHMAADGVRGTPTFFVNGKRVSTYEMKDIEAAIADASK
ncbi:thioredoxin domain-containing protein [Asticcacaulis sp. AC466]|uniref:thioredoxin domain-containing protein n=1 Tax=Asticcacaulis sp. AC466 TaxID=1282362 RepID=UPI000413BAD9|nr:thioredoxin domain-containing protein [Asticcacaulis sp. AC466]